ncbi:hypothetical protein ACTJJ4_07160 [Microbacterium sp. 22195]|uniref:hypothetical protein n=1 Tax=Microbacterium sp. 22195 TaxID=3453891 RepID=UPI003F83AFA4
MTIENTNVSRRTLVKGAAWSLPVVAVAAATPLAAASTGTASAQWTQANTQLLTLGLLDNSGTVSASVLPSAPTQFRITNGATELPNVTAVFTAALSTAGLNITVPVGTTKLRGFAPSAVAGGTRVGNITITDREIASVALLGTTYAQDTAATYSLGTIAPNAALDFDTTWGATGREGLNISLGVATSVTVVVSLQSNGVEFAQLSGSNINMLANAGVL